MAVAYNENKTKQGDSVLVSPDAGTELEVHCPARDFVRAMYGSLDHWACVGNHTAFKDR